MLPRQPLRFLLADDPGAGKTIMTGLFIRSSSRAATSRAASIVCPGSPRRAVAGRARPTKFDLPFDILTNDKLEAARIGNSFAEQQPRSSPAWTSSPATRTSRRSSRPRRPTGTSSCSTRPTRCPPPSSAARSRTPSATASAELLAPAHPPLPAPDRDAAQRQGGGLPAVHGACSTATASRAKFRDGVHAGRRVRPHAPDGQGEPAQVRRDAALPRAHRLHRPLQALRRRGRPLRARSPSTSARR